MPSLAVNQRINTTSRHSEGSGKTTDTAAAIAELQAKIDALVLLITTQNSGQATGN